MIQVTDPIEIFIQAVDLFERSPLHREWSIRDFVRLVMPAIRARQILILKADETPVGLATWAWLDPIAEAGFLNNTRKLQPGDWTRNPGDRLWVIDLIAPGRAAWFSREVERHLTDQGHDEARWVRRNRDGSVRKTGSYSRKNRR